MPSDLVKKKTDDLVKFDKDGDGKLSMKEKIAKMKSDVKEGVKAVTVTTDADVRDATDNTPTIHYQPTKPGFPFSSDLVPLLLWLVLVLE